MLYVDEMMTVLAQCDLFYMAGIFTVPDAWVARAHGPAFRLVEEIQTRVQYNAMAFVGVCGGALMSGSQPYRGLPPLDLLQGATAWYDSCCSKAPVHTTHNLVQFTTGCAVAIYTWHDHREAVSFPVMKNSSQWNDFAEESSRVLQDFVVQKCSTPKLFQFEGEMWFMTLAGYV